MGVLDGFRNLLKIRKDRQALPPGPKPRQGAKIFLHDVRMTVQAGLSNELWAWLRDLGFREIAISPDRRRYRDLPPSLVARLYDAPPDDWRPLLKQAIRQSVSRSTATADARSAKVA